MRLKSGAPIESYQVLNMKGLPVEARISSLAGDGYQITLGAGAEPGVYILTYKVQGMTRQSKFVLSN
jgi:hypothetical protein